MSETLKMKPRRCLYCRKRFTPTRNQDKDSKFCAGTDHRGLWHKHGTKRYRELMELMVQELKRQADEAAMLRLTDAERASLKKQKQEQRSSDSESTDTPAAEPEHSDSRED